MDHCKNLPEKFLDRLKRIYNDKEYDQILDAFGHKLLPSFRVNPLKIRVYQLVEKLEKDGFEIKSIPWYTDAFILQNKSIRELTETDAYKHGELYIQNLSSMLPAIIMEPQPDELVLDMAAAPGSKTTQMAAMMQNKGLIVANDVSRARLYKMEALLKQYAIPFQKTQTTQIARLSAISEYQKIRYSDDPTIRQSDSPSFPSVLMMNVRGESLWKQFPELFDKTLVDVPCAMEGRIQCDDVQTYADWSTKKIKQLSQLQKYLLRSAITATKPGGTIVYSTCTLAPEENEEVVDWVLKKSDGAISIEKIELPNLPLKPGLTAWNKPFHPQVTNTVRITPSHSMEGFFVAKIKKLTSNLPASL